MKSLLVALLSVFLINTLTAQNYYQHKSLMMGFEYGDLGEKSPDNPFLNYRLEVTFSLGSHSFSVPGYYAADGNAAETAATSGNRWRVHFTPPLPGKWTYLVSFKKGARLAVSDDPYEGEGIEGIDGRKGTILVKPASNDAESFEKTGRLKYHNSHYLYTENGEPFLKFGANSPENFLAYDQFDATYPYDPKVAFPKTWKPHEKDWKEGDPTWQNGKGKGIIGALNYLASKGMNCLYALTLNIEGDAKDVWPFLSYKKKDFLRYDVSKLAQWDVVFTHAEKLGIVLNLVTQEKENELILDDGDTRLERKLYYRELLARFAHHKNIIWNMGEENGQVEFWPQGQSDQQRYAMIRYLKDHDPYKNPVVIHTMSTREHRKHILEGLLGFDRLDGLSMQVNKVGDIHDDLLHWMQLSKEKKRPWIMMMDEIGPWHTGTRPDSEDPKHDSLRNEVLWGTLMAGGTGVEWYFGWLTPPHDLNAEDWRSRDNIWEQSHHAHEFFKKIPFAEMKSRDDLIANRGDYCFAKLGEVYTIYLKNGGSTSLDLRDVTGKFKIEWYNPREGGDLWVGSLAQMNAGSIQNIGLPPTDFNQDWAVLIKKL